MTGRVLGAVQLRRAAPPRCVYCQSAPSGSEIVSNLMINELIGTILVLVLDVGVASRRVASRRVASRRVARDSSRVCSSSSRLARFAHSPRLAPKFHRRQPCPQRGGGSSSSRHSHCSPGPEQRPSGCKSLLVSTICQCLPMCTPKSTCSLAAPSEAYF